jgi:Na+-translocating ferredoxin:NAD+ oxidoreductase subunit C
MNDRSLPLRFPGGLALDIGRHADTGGAIRPCPPPPRLAIPLSQHAGLPAEPCVQPGDRVLRGQCIGRAPQGLGAAVHASTSGTVLAIEPAAVAHLSGLPQPCVLIEVDGLDEGVRLPQLPDWRERPATELLQRLREAGVVGLGGATFPTDEKLAVVRQQLILNGAECEPWIGCDDALLRERAEEVLAGAELLARLCGAERIRIAVEDDMPAAAAALRTAIGSRDIELSVLPARYPQGGERQLIQTLTGLEVPRGGLPRDIGVVVQNVATAAAAWRAVVHGEPLTARIVSLAGPGLMQPGNWEVRLGTPIEWLIAQAGGYRPEAARLILGGPLMGLALPHDGFHITKASNCVLVLDAASVADAQPELPCIRCGECSRVCPAGLLPQQLQLYARALDAPQLQSFGLFDCIECGCCDLVCPSHIPLVDWYRYAKAELRARGQAEAEAQAAKRRFEARAARLEREAAERAAQRAAKAVEPDAVRAAIERARKKRDSGIGIRDS